MATIIRTKLTEKFTVLPNETLRDNRLSFRARGVLAMVLSHSRDFKITATWLEQQGTEGKEAVRGALKELKRLGFVKFDRVNNTETGNIDCVWTFRDLAMNPSANSPSDGKPLDGFPSDGKPSYLRRTSPKEELKRKEEEKIPPVEKTRNQPTKDNSPHHQVVKAWCDSFKSKNGFDYIFNGRDGKEVAAMLKSIPADNLVILIADAMKQKDEKKFWTCVHKTGSTWDFAFNINKIRAELKAKVKIPRENAWMQKWHSR